MASIPLPPVDPRTRSQENRSYGVLNYRCFCRWAHFNVKLHFYLSLWFLFVIFSSRWAGCNTLLIDVAAFWMIINETDVDLVIMETSDQQWKLPRHQAFAPPLFEVGSITSTCYWLQIMSANEWGTIGVTVWVLYQCQVAFLIQYYIILIVLLAL